MFLGRPEFLFFFNRKNFLNFCFDLNPVFQIFLYFFETKNFFDFYFFLFLWLKNSYKKIFLNHKFSPYFLQETNTKLREMIATIDDELQR